ncbi:hypothetical protein ACS0TY_001120 [Phlomoides rotata]
MIMDRAREKRPVSYSRRRALPDKSPIGREVKVSQDAFDMEESIDPTYEDGVGDWIEALQKEVDLMRNSGGPYSVPEMKINALTNDLRDGDLFSSLSKKHVHTFDELLKRAEKYVTLEKVRKAKKAGAKTSAHDKKKELEKKNAGPDPPKPGKPGPRGRYEKYTPLKLENAAGHLEMKFSWSRSKRHSNPKDRQDPRGNKRKEPEEKCDEKRKSPSRNVGDTPPQKRRLIQMIVEGPTDGDSGRAWKSIVRALKAQQKREYQEVGRVVISPRIHFGPEDRQDMKEPRKDAFVITTDISGFDVARIFARHYVLGLHQEDEFGGETRACRNSSLCSSPYSLYDYDSQL